MLDTLTMTLPVSVWLVEDDTDYRDTLQLFLRQSPDFECEQAFGSVEALFAEVRARREVGVEEGWPGLIVLDINLPGQSGTDALPQVRALLPEARVVMLTLHEDARHIFAALERGASGYMTKGLPLARVHEVLRDASTGGMSLPPPVARLVRDHFAQRPAVPDYDLTDRERDVLQAMVDGDSQKEIAYRLNISPTTVNTHIRSLYRKLHVHSGTAAVAKALRERLLGDE